MLGLLQKRVSTITIFKKQEIWWKRTRKKQK